MLIDSLKMSWTTFPISLVDVALKRATRVTNYGSDIWVFIATVDHVTPFLSDKQMPPVQSTSCVSLESLTMADLGRVLSLP